MIGNNFYHLALIIISPCICALVCVCVCVGAQSEV